MTIQARLCRAARAPVNAPLAAATLRSLAAIGLRPSAASLKVNDLILRDLLDESSYYQDFAADHPTIERLHGRVRTYFIAPDTSTDRRDQCFRAARREAQLLAAVADHPRVLRLLHYSDDGPLGGPAIVFERFDGSVPLDAFLRNNPDLAFGERLELIGQIAEAVEFCHRKQVHHRALSPRTVLVRRGAPTSDGPGVLEVRVFNFQLGTEGDSAGTLHVTSLVHEDASVYLAPEVIQDPARADARADVFSLGCVAYFILTGRAPAASLQARAALLEAQGGHLSISAARDDLAVFPRALTANDDDARRLRSLDDVIGLATEVQVAARADRVIDWLAANEAPYLRPGGWSGGRIERARSAFASRDLEALRGNSEAIALGLARRDVTRGRGAGTKATELLLIQHEATKQKRHLPIRALVASAQAAMMQLRPCWMMSPLSVAQYLTSATPTFDMIVLDEASQLRPEDAIGALLRGRQAVIVGDSMQLPPTDFFRAVERDDEEDDEQVDDVAESILDLAAQRLPDAVSLEWHYRSRHPSLMQFSNQTFYRDRLMVFPAPRAAGPRAGVHYRFVDGPYHASTNQVEAEAVCEAVLAHMRDHQNRSLGVVAMNSKQADLIRELVDAALLKEDLEFVEGWRDDPESFFVKNLENVQGDERDTIFVSLTYGPTFDATGRRVAPKRIFGPITRDYGHRRLNVLFSRAKHQLVVFSSLRPEDVEPRGEKHQGIEILHGYLQYAQQQGRARGSATPHVLPGEFARHLRSVLERAGYQADFAFGRAGSAIDVAVRRPGAADYLCAIECDRSLSATQLPSVDRDRIRRQLLEDLDWSIITLWTVDWYRDPAAAEGTLLDALAERCRRAGVHPPAPRRRSDGAVDPGGGGPAGGESEAPQQSDATAVASGAETTPAENSILQRLRARSAATTPRWRQLERILRELLRSDDGSLSFERAADAAGVVRPRVNGLVSELETLNAQQVGLVTIDHGARRVRVDWSLLTS